MQYGKRDCQLDLIDFLIENECLHNGIAKLTDAHLRRQFSRDLFYR